MLDARPAACPDAVVACVGGGSNAMGIFHALPRRRRASQLVGFEAGGDGRRDRPARRRDSPAARPACCTARARYVMQDDDGPDAARRTRSRAGLDYPGVGPEHACLHDTGRAAYRPGHRRPRRWRRSRVLCRTEGIIPAIESAHALAGAMRLGRELGPEAVILVNLSGRGDKDVDDGGPVVRPARRRRAGGDDRLTRTACADVRSPARAEGRAALDRLPARPGFPTVERSVAAHHRDGRGRRRHHRGRACPTPTRSWTARSSRPPSTPRCARGTDHGHVLRRSRARWRATGGADPGHDVLEPDRAVRRRPLRRATWPPPAGPGVITPDLTPEEAGPWIAATDDARAGHGLPGRAVVDPTSASTRSPPPATGFVYAASTMGVTGARTQVGSGAAELVAQVRAAHATCRRVGLGVSTGAAGARGGGLRRRRHRRLGLRPCLLDAPTRAHGGQSGGGAGAASWPRASGAAEPSGALAAADPLKRQPSGPRTVY